MANMNVVCADSTLLVVVTLYAIDAIPLYYLVLLTLLQIDYVQKR